jgi:hypothetical protein
LESGCRPGEGTDELIPLPTMAMQHAKCPFCGLKLFRDVEALAIAHQSPECERFTVWANRLDNEAREVQAEALPAHFEALRRRVKARRN